MQKKINLIPLDLAVPASSVRLAKLLNKISFVGIILFIVSTVSMISLLVFYSFNLKDSNAKVASLKSKVASLEKNEQKLYLAKDRIAKIAEVKKLDLLRDDIAKFEGFTNGMAAITESRFSEISINSKKVEVSVYSTTTQSLTDVFKLITDVNGYKNIILSSLGYAPVSGYISSLIFNTE